MSGLCERAREYVRASRFIARRMSIFNCQLYQVFSFGLDTILSSDVMPLLVTDDSRRSLPRIKVIQMKHPPHLQ